MDNIAVIELDLGLKVQDLIEREILQLTRTSRDKLDATIEAAKAQEQERVKKEEAATQKAGAIQDLYDELAGSEVGLEAKAMYERFQCIASSPSALTLKLKGHIKSLGNKFRLVKNVIDGKSYFKFEKFNSD